jgi:curved DNA-binding protein CbpA
LPDRIPEFDLYAELEVSRSATKAAIEAAYRSLAKQTHPDATGKSDARFKRINIARQWLTDSELRRRYDGATWFLAKLDGTSSMADAPLRTGDGWSARRAGSRPAGAADASGQGATAASRPARTWAPPSADAPEQARFGVNDAEVRQFLADLRSLNRSRAEEVKRGIGAADVSGRGEARRAAFAAGKQRRLREWLFAREAASIIVGTAR